jgi:hypothetical protein
MYLLLIVNSTSLYLESNKLEGPVVRPVLKQAAHPWCLAAAFKNRTFITPGAGPHISSPGSVSIVRARHHNKVLGSQPEENKCPT